MKLDAIAKKRGVRTLQVVRLQKAFLADSDHVTINYAGDTGIAFTSELSFGYVDGDVAIGEQEQRSINGSTPHAETVDVVPSISGEWALALSIKTCSTDGTSEVEVSVDATGDGQP